MLTDPKGATTHYTYDALGRLTAVTDALGGISRYGYDARGLMTALTDANGHVRSYTYDGARRLSAETDALGRARSYRYDASGNLVQATDAKGQLTTLTYDGEDRLVRISYADGTAVSYTRDAAGSRISMVDPLGTTTYRYDLLRRLTQLTDPAGGTVGYGYDANGNRAGLVYPDSRPADYTYDALDRLTAVTFAGQTTRYSYDAVGDPTTAAFGNGTRSAATYDPLGRLTALTNTDGGGKVASAFTYAYDPLGNVTSETASGARDLRETFGYEYDALSRLVGVTDREKKATRYGYDAVGNRTSITRNGGADTLTATFDPADQLTRWERAGSLLETFRYDANGSLVGRVSAEGTTAFTWDAAARLVGVRSGDQQRTYAYDGDGNLRRESGSDDPRSLAYTLDLAGPLSQVLTASDGKDSAAYLYGLSRIAAFGPATRYYGADVRGSVRSTTDERGRVTFVQRYDAWGTPNDQGDGSAKLASLFGYAGERQDAKVGLEQLRARWYAPDLGAFLSRDPAPGTRSDPRSLAPYAYAENDPTSRVDPSGRSSTSLFRQLPPPGFMFVRDGCTGALLALPDFSAQIADALGLDQRPPSLAELGLIPTLVCNQDVQFKQPIRTSPCPSASPVPGLGTGQVMPTLFGQAGIGLTFGGSSKAGGCDSVGVGGALYAKATGTKGGGPTSSGGAVPPYEGGKVTGVLEVGSDELVVLISGREGPAKELPKGTRGFNLITKTHVEGHAAAVMRQKELTEATLLINKIPCGSPQGCEYLLSRMLPEGARLRVVGPGGFEKVYVGLPVK